MKQDELPVERMVEILEDILAWTKVGMYAAVEQMLERQFGTEDTRPEELLAFELCDGAMKQKDVVEACKATLGPGARISPGPLSRWITKWEKLGLVKRDGVRTTRLFSLRDFGFDVPQLKESAQEKSDSGNTSP